MPVVNEDGEVAGVISEADLLVKEGGPRERRRGPLAWLLDRIDLEEQLKLNAHFAGDAMTGPGDHDRAVPLDRCGGPGDAGARHQPPPGRQAGSTRRDCHPRRPRARVRAFGRADCRGGSRPGCVLAGARERLRAGRGDHRRWRGDAQRSSDRRSTAESLPVLAARVPGVVGARLAWVEDDSKPSRAPGRETVF